VEDYYLPPRLGRGGDGGGYDEEEEEEEEEEEAVMGWDGDGFHPASGGGGGGNLDGSFMRRLQLTEVDLNGRKWLWMGDDCKLQDSPAIQSTRGVGVGTCRPVWYAHWVWV
jgi:hypothetical protein